jgi:hypothetical protein
MGGGAPVDWKMENGEILFFFAGTAEQYKQLRLKD